MTLSTNSQTSPFISIVCLLPDRLSCGAAVSSLLLVIGGNLVAYDLSALHRSVLDNVRPAIVWIVMLVVHYASNNPKLGEAWTWWPFLELGGFILLIIATGIYNAIIKVRCLFRYEDEPFQEDRTINNTSTDPQPIPD